MRLNYVALITGLAAIAAADHAGLGHVLPPVIAIRDDDVKCAEPPKLCTGAVMLEGASTTLTYVCPKTVSVTTVHVTVTKTETLPVVVSTTDVAAPVKGPPAEPTTTSTIHSTTTSTKTYTVTRKTTTRSALYTSIPSVSGTAQDSSVQASTSASSTQLFISASPMLNVSHSTVHMTFVSTIPLPVVTSPINFISPSPTAPFINTTASLSFHTDNPHHSYNMTATISASMVSASASADLSFPSVGIPTPDISMLPIDSKYDRIQESTLNGGHALVPTMKYARQENSTATSIAATGTEGAKPSGNATATGPPINGAGHIGVEVGAIVGLVGIVALW